MTESLSRDTQAVLLLCGRFAPKEQADPLDLREYNRVVDFLQKQSLRPAFLLDDAALDLDWSESGIERSRLQDLLQRGMALGLAAERWINGGLWILSRSDDDYPSRLRQHLGRSAPPLLWGVGDRRLLNGRGVAIVGSRDVDEADVAWTGEIASACASEGITVISGGARGSDQVAMAASARG
jgi:Predicted Rossmann fold nucleotide-binding protein involved in DNA uptake